MKGRLAFVAFVAVLVHSGPAEAFCRSTSCSGGCDRDAQGCKTDGKPLFWPTSCVGFSLQEDGSEHIDFAAWEAVVAASFVAWSDVDCGNGFASIAFARLDDVACHRAEYVADGPNANVVMFQDYKWDYTSQDNTLAKTTVTYDSETGAIRDADIELNHAFNEFTLTDDGVVYDLQAVLTHEIGHFIGLDHTSDPAATMNAGYAKGDTHQRDLDADDVAGLCAAYPPNRNAACDPEPIGGLADECADEDRDGGEESCAMSPPGASGFSSRLGLVALALLALRRGRISRPRAS